MLDTQQSFTKKKLLNKGPPEFIAKRLKALKSSYKFNKFLGWTGERLAIYYLKYHCYLICRENYRTKKGEIDIIAIKNKKIHFIEVKTSLNFNSKYSNLARINQNKKKRIQKLANDYLFSQRKDFIKYRTKMVSFDVISINLNQLFSTTKILKHYQNYY